MRSLGLVRSSAALVAAAIIGGAVAVGAVALLGGLEGATTMVTQTVASPRMASETTPRGSMSINEIYENAAPGVVQITSTSGGQTSTAADPFSTPLPQMPSTSLGSGFVVDKAGHIVTNYHVVSGADQIRVGFSNRDTVEAKVVGADPSTDLAVLLVETGSEALTPLALGDSDAVRVGDQVVAIGNPFGLSRTATAGIVSALQRYIQAPNSYTIDHVIQTDAPINKGNSGGPLLNARGEVIGVNTQIETGDTATGNVGIGFAVPSNTVKDVVAQILRTGHVDRAYLGIVGQSITPDLVDTFKLPVEQGVLVQSVASDSAADKAGLEGGDTEVVVAGETYVLGGDVIEAFDGEKISSIEKLRDAIAALEPGDKAKLQLYRDDKKLSVTVTLGRQPPSPQG